MKMSIIFFLLFFSSSFLNAQTRFNYDVSGNRKSRTIVLPDPAQSQTMQEPDNDKNIETSNDEETTLESEEFYADKLKESNVFIYPNPTKGALAVEIRKKDPKDLYNLSVYTLNGTMVFQQTNISDYTKVDLLSQPRGVYLLRISTSDTFITWKIVKE